MKKKWGRQKDDLIRDFGRLVQNKNKKKNRKIEIFFDATKCLVFADATGLSNSSDFMSCDENIQSVPADNSELNNIDTTASTSSDSSSSQIPTTSKDNSTSNKTPNNADICNTYKKPSKKGLILTIAL